MSKESTRLKIPCEMAVFACSEHKYKQVGCYTASHFIYSGNAHSSDKPVHAVAEATGYPVKSVYRYFRWLICRNWFGKNSYGRYYFRGIDQVHQIEGWKFARAAMMRSKDLQNIQAFMAGVVCASLVQTGKGQRGEQVKGCSKHDVGPISLSVLADVLDVSTRHAQKLRKMADEANYIRNKPTLTEITNWTPEDLKELKKQDLHYLPVELLGYADKKVTAIDRIRYKDDKLFLQEANTIKYLLQLKSRKGLSQYQPPNPSTNVRTK
ncbi:hypothetical protein [Fodinibius salsisoli]|uniref:Uncharacterized protein n=1 Tax=Fodinibius salsisoli TaxID=2820877 RepID=A0ABT3PQF7_9BACT|nr:hypothetical protein [Fodinibius salsisoli]MCW9708088.1 hypothetical protein [Fodinibius salsisoli]